MSELAPKAAATILVEAEHNYSQRGDILYVCVRVCLCVRESVFMYVCVRGILCARISSANFGSRAHNLCLFQSTTATPTTTLTATSTATAMVKAAALHDRGRGRDRACSRRSRV